MPEKKTVNISKKLIVFIAICITVIVVLICKSILDKKDVEIAKNENYKLPIEYYYSGIQNKDFETYLKAYPEFMQISAMVKEEDLNNYYETYKEECGENIVISYEFGETKAYTEEEVAKLEEKINLMYGTEVEFTEAYDINVKEIYTGDNKKIEREIKRTVFKYNGQWYSV